MKQKNKSDNDPESLSPEQMKQLLETGLSKIVITNMVKKYRSWDLIMKKIPTKLEEVKVKEYLVGRLGKEMKVTKRKLEKIKDFKLQNPKQVFYYDFPMLPSVNHMYMTTFTGGRQLKPEYVKLFLELQDIIDIELVKQNWEPVHKTKVIAEMIFYLDRKKDCHNMEKFLLDVMDGILYDDDFYVLPRIIDFEMDKEKPRIEFKLYVK